MRCMFEFVCDVCLRWWVIYLEVVGDVCLKWWVMYV